VAKNLERFGRNLPSVAYHKFDLFWCIKGLIVTHTSFDGCLGSYTPPSLDFLEGTVVGSIGCFQTLLARVQKTFELNQLKSAPSQLLLFFSGLDRLQTCCDSFAPVNILNVFFSSVG
jgi:hypothetical protein